MFYVRRSNSNAPKNNEARYLLVDILQAALDIIEGSHDDVMTTELTDGRYEGDSEEFSPGSS